MVRMSSKCLRQIHVHVHVVLHIVWKLHGLEGQGNAVLAAIANKRRRRKRRQDGGEHLGLELPTTINKHHPHTLPRTPTHVSCKFKTPLFDCHTCTCTCLTEVCILNKDRHRGTQPHSLNVTNPTR